MNIRMLLIGEIVAFVVLLGLGLWATLSLSQGGGSDALYVNIAGRQRMLSQRAAKEALLFAAAPTPEHRADLEETAQLFTTSLRALRIGGATPLGLDGGAQVELRGASDDELATLLGQVDAQWRTMSSSIDGLLEAAKARDVAMKTLLEKNPRLLENMDAAVRYLAAESTPSASMVNIAGRQRMLSQRTALQALLVDVRPTENLRADLEQSIRLFEKSHQSLRSGGPAPSRLDGSRPIRLPGTKVSRITAKLDEVEDDWRAQAGALQTIALDDTAYRAAVAGIKDANPKVLTTMNDAVLRAQVVADNKLQFLQNVQIVALALGMIVAVLGAFLAVSIGRSLDRLRRVADDISRGQVDQRLEPVGIGEVRALSQSFERMRYSLNATMDILDDNADGDLGV